MGFFNRKVSSSPTGSGASLSELLGTIIRARECPERNVKKKLFEELLEKDDAGIYRKAILYAYDPFKVFKTTGMIKFKDRMSIPSRMRLQFRHGRPGAEAVFEKLDELAAAKGCTYDDEAELCYYCPDKATYDVVTAILNKNFDCGLAQKTFGQIIPELPQHSPMLCDLDFEKFCSGLTAPDRAVISLKLDGVRTWAVTTPDEVKYVSRDGKEYNNFYVFDEDIVCLRNALIKSNVYPEGATIIFDGEAIGEDRDFEKFISNAKDKEGDTSNFHYYVFDLVTPEKNLEERLNLLHAAECSLSARDHHNVSILEHKKQLDLSADTIFRMVHEAVENGEEGYVIKNLDAPYVFTRSTTWCKLKEMKDADLPVIGKFEGKGKYKGLLGGLIVRVFGKPVKVGSGFTDQQRKDFWKNTPEVITVKYQNLTKAMSLRFPVFLRVRDDKHAVDCDFQTENDI